MSNKLNAEELAAKRYSLASAFLNPSLQTVFRSDDFDARVECKREGYAAAIREVAQPIADERDELRQALEQLLMACADGSNASMYIGTSNARAILAKYPKP
jgi:hypothetical protein